MSDSSLLPVASGRETFAAAWSLLRRRPLQLIAVVAILLLGAVSGLVTPWILGTLVDLIAEGAADARTIWLFGSAIVGSALLSAATGGMGIVFAARLFETTLAELREEFIEHALSLPQMLVEKAGTGDLVSRASDDVSEVSYAIPSIVPAFTSALFTIAVTVTGMAVIDARFALALLVVVPVYFFTVRWYLRVAPAVYAAQRAAVATRAHHVLASLRGIDTVLAYRLDETHASRIARASWEVVRWAMRARTVQNMFAGRLNFAEYLGLSALLVAGYLLVSNDLATIGATTTAVLLLLRVFEPVGELLFVLDDAQAAGASLARLVGVARGARSTPRQSESSKDGATVAVLKDVSFAYDPGHPVLHGVSMRVRAGERIALVGTSGAGKTTIAALLAGIHEPTDGVVQRPVKTLLLSQETHVFAGTIAENLTIARPSATEEELRLALAVVGAEDFLGTLREGLATDVGHGGHALTAAQSQQLVLARLVLADPELAILDEATADADSADAGLLDRAAAAAVRGRAALVVAHRLSQAAVCDRILVVEDGRIVEEGTQDGLVAAGGRYAALWEAWSRMREAE